MKFIIIVALLSFSVPIPGVAQVAGAGMPLTYSDGNPCDSVSLHPGTDEVELSNVSVNGGGNAGVVSPNDSITITLDYKIQVCTEPLTENFCQVVVGFASSSRPLFCILRERVDCTGANGSLSFRIKAPAFPSEYILAFDVGRELSETPCPFWWPQGPPTAERYLACISVVSANIPVPLTGGVDSVSPSSAILLGTVNPAGAATTVRFLFGTSPGSYHDSVHASMSPVSGTTTVPVSVKLTGLAENTRYFYRLTAESENGYNVGDERSFVTGPVFIAAETTHVFGHLSPNVTRIDTILILNNGNLPLAITQVIPQSGQYAVFPTSGVIDPAESMQFALTFSPPTYGKYHSGIIFFHNGATSPDTLFVQGDVPIGSVLPGWNIVSVPLTVADPRKSVVFPDATSGAFGFSSGYVASDTVVNGRGYWLKFPATDSLVVGGDPRESETVDVTAGWNMVGGPSYPVPLDSVESNPPGIVESGFFGYAAGYSPVTVLAPGRGYWVKVSEAGTLTLKGQVPGDIPPGSRP